MNDYFLLSRVLLRFDGKSDDLLGDISAVARTPEGNLWVASDELIGVERLSPVEPYVYGDHETFAIADYIDVFNLEDEIDIEGMDYSDHYLWFTGSHSTKRNKPKGKKENKDIQRLSEIKTDLNRYLLARIPVINGELVKSCSLADNPDAKLSAACLEKNETSNILIDALREDPHLAPILSIDLPSKDNGLDIEGLAVKGDRIFLGLRGPVLRGWAIIIEIEVVEGEPGKLTLKEIGDQGKLYKKHFLELNGLGVRELCLRGEDLLILAGPTMDLEGEMQVFRWKDVADQDEDSITFQDDDNLEALFDLPFTVGNDHAEGLSLFPCLGYPESLLIVYDSPAPRRRISEKEIFADVFRIL
jgi:hypothetical protein